MPLKFYSIDYKIILNVENSNKKEFVGTFKLLNGSVKINL